MEPDIWSTEAAKELEHCYQKRSTKAGSTPYIRKVLSIPAKKNSIKILDIPSENTTAKQSSDNDIGDLFWPVIRFLSLAGHIPLTREVQGSSHGVQALTTHSGAKSIWSATPEYFKPKTKPTFVINVKSMSFLWSTTVAVITIICLSCFLLDIILGIQGQPVIFGFGQLYHAVAGDDTSLARFAKPSVLVAIKMQMILMPIYQLVDCVTVLFETGSMAEFLNNWREFQQEFIATFSYFKLWESSVATLRKVQKRMLLFIAVGPSLLMVPILTIVSYSRAPSTGVMLLILPCIIHGSLVSFVEDVKVNLTFRTISHAFNQIRQGIQQSSKWEHLTPAKVQQWRKLMYLVKAQAKIVGKMYKNHELIIIALIMIIVTVSLFVFLNGPWCEIDNMILLITFLFYTSFMVLKLYTKILSGHSVYVAEREIAKELVFLTTGEDDVQAQLEIKFFYDMIMDSPTVISYGNYVNVSKKLILGITSQIVTYMIVILQFTQSYRGHGSVNLCWNPSAS